jgi:sulfhydrogenase subunit alpha
MPVNAKINVHHLTRVEGHGNIVVNVTQGKVEKCEWQVPEAPRFFESMVRGRHYSEVARITSRICGICSVGHTLASVKATEAALGIQISAQTLKLRELLKHAENFDSHVLHVYMLAAPDLLGAKSVFPLVKTHTAVVARALQLKRLGHEWGSLIGGRTTHPTTAVPGGFTSVPTVKELKELKQKLLAAAPDLIATLETVASLAPKIPAFSRPTEYIGQASDKNYGLYDGVIQSVMPDGKKERYPVADYKKVTNEFMVPQSTAKYTRHKLPSYAAGALARFNNSYDRLVPEAKKAAQALGLKPICVNPYMNTVAQVVEIVESYTTRCGWSRSCSPPASSSSRSSSRPSSRRAPAPPRFRAASSSTSTATTRTASARGATASSPPTRTTPTSRATSTSWFRSWWRGTPGRRRWSWRWRCWSAPTIPASPARPTSWT